MKKIIATMAAFIMATLLVAGCESVSQEHKLTDAEKTAIERTVHNHYTKYEVQAAALATCIYEHELGRDYEAHYPLRADISGGDSDIVWYGGDYGYQGEIVIHIYEDHPDHILSHERYLIDCSTWTGTGNASDKVDLRGALAGLSVSPGWTKK